MTLSLSAENFAALQARRLYKRDFIWFVVRDRSTGNPVTDGYWSDVGNLDAQVIDPDSGATVTRTFAGAGGLISISDIPRVSNLTVQTITVKLAQVADRVNNLVRGYDCKQGKVQIFCGLFNLDTHNMIAPAFPRFAGTIDQAPITTPPAGQTGDVTLTCTGNTAELTRSNPDTRSDASQRLRSATDNFYQDTAVVSEWQQYWGKQSGPIDLVSIAKSAGFFR
ncbi:hypothetical protein [Bradyrhizobium sp. BR 10289]|uniref:hypothetical protein n=1 Tax=Bradyrhizobium sp. BR 10289 TaxID=2749993 RepID=UPI001C651EF8|nr:hypothetical protein [Bradyrhizobium sp. BR 10289]MBW7968112.1 hypothetical protein [Bradyrhizobium sp. BR 10289]